jgi:site-specific DNA-methyltransferase (adenine-specific)
MIELHHGDCLEIMKNIPDKSVDCIICDLPYGITACEWDNVIPFDELWKEYNRIINAGQIILFGSQPFTSLLISSNLKMFKYELIWDKIISTGFALANKRPLKRHENICIFSAGKVKYNPIMVPRQKERKYNNRGKIPTSGSSFLHKDDGQERTLTAFYPTSIVEISNANRTKIVHPTQKPVSLMEYLVKTYTNENDVVLDNCMGSGTTGVACKNLNRSFIGIELERKYFEIAKERIDNTNVMGL